jgi:hypothetical protein
VIYIKSLKKLGDTVHAYCVAKSSEDIKVIVPEKWLTLFDQNYVTVSDHTGDNVYLLHGNCKENIVVPKDDHVRNTLWEVIKATGKCGSHPLNIKPFNFIKPTVILCNRTPVPYKLWDGEWDALRDYLNSLGYDVFFDRPEIELSTLISYIAGAKFIISVDTSCIHIADAYSVPVIGLYTNTSIKQFGPYMDSRHCLEGDISLEDIKIKVQELINIGN